MAAKEDASSGGCRDIIEKLKEQAKQLAPPQLPQQTYTQPEPSKSTTTPGIVLPDSTSQRRPPTNTRSFISFASRPGYRGNDTAFLQVAEGKLVILDFTPGTDEDGPSQWFYIPKYPAGQSLQVFIEGGERSETTALVQQSVSNKLVYNYIPKRTDVRYRDSTIFPGLKIVEMPLSELRRLNEGGTFRLLGSQWVEFSMWCEGDGEFAASPPTPRPAPQQTPQAPRDYSRGNREAEEAANNLRKTLEELYQRLNK